MLPKYEVNKDLKEGDTDLPSATEKTERREKTKEKVNEYCIPVYI